MNDLYLTKISIDNFRTFGSFELRMPPTAGLTLVVGPNGLGKSSFFDSIEWALTGVIRRFDRYLKKSLTEDMYLTRRGAPEDSHSVSLTFDKHIVERDASTEPDPDAVIALLKSAAWDSSIEDLSTYLAFTHFLGQSSNERFTSRGSEEQWNALKGPSGIDRLEDVRNALRGRATQIAFNRRIERDTQEVNECAERLTNWQLWMGRLSRLRQVADAGGAVTKEQVLQDVDELESLVTTLTTNPESSSQFSKTSDPLNRLSRLRKVLESVRSEIERRLVVYTGLVATTNEYTAIRAVADAGGPAIELAKSNTDDFSEARQQMLRRLNQTQDSLRKQRADASSLESETLLLNRAADDRRTVAANAESIAALSAERTQFERSVKRFQSEQVALRKELEDAQAIDAKYAAAVVGTERAAVIASNAESLRDAERRAEDARKVATVARDELAPLEQNRHDLEARHEAIQAEINEAEIQVSEAANRASEISAALARLAAYLTENDTECPVCRSNFPKGQLLVLARASSEGRDTILTAAEAALASRVNALARIRADIQTIADRYENLVADIRKSEEMDRSVGARRERIVDDLGITAADDLVAATAALERRAASEIQAAKAQRDEFYRNASQKTARVEQLDVELQTVRRALQSTTDRIGVLEQDSRVAVDRLNLQGRASESEQDLLQSITDRQALLVDLRTQIDASVRELELLADEEALMARRLLEAQSQLKSQEASVESASKNATAIEAQWRAAGLSGLPNAATLTGRRASLSKQTEEADRLLADQGRLVSAYEKAIQNEELRQLSEQMSAVGGPGSAEDPQEYEQLLTKRLRDSESKKQTSEGARATVMALGERLQKTATDFSTRFLLPLNDLIERFNEALLSYPGEMIRFRASHHLDKTRFDMQLKLRQRGENLSDELDLPPQIVLSEGQLAANGFSILCAASVAYPWSKWRALLLDDPLQHNDIIHTAAFVDLMRNLVQRSGYQLLMSSHDRGEADFIYRKFDAAGLPCTVVELTVPSREGVVHLPVRYNDAAKNAMSRGFSPS
jgi:DNA repair exonuclease SbcCD ATPase subunit